MKMFLFAFGMLSFFFSMQVQAEFTPEQKTYAYLFRDNENILLFKKLAIAEMKLELLQNNSTEKKSSLEGSIKRLETEIKAHLALEKALASVEKKSERFSQEKFNAGCVRQEKVYQDAIDYLGKLQQAGDLDAENAQTLINAYTFSQVFHKARCEEGNF